MIYGRKPWFRGLHCGFSTMKYGRQQDLGQAEESTGKRLFLSKHSKTSVKVDSLLLSRSFYFISCSVSSNNGLSKNWRTVISKPSQIFFIETTPGFWLFWLSILYMVDGDTPEIFARAWQLLWFCWGLWKVCSRSSEVCNSNPKQSNGRPFWFVRFLYYPKKRRSISNSKICGKDWSECN